jgi:hypothetical protein
MFLKPLRVLAIATPALVMTGLASAQTAPPRHVPLPKAIGVAKAETVSSCFVVREVLKIPPSVHGCKAGFVPPQDLFDRNNPNNLRSDYPAPPAQPGQF